MDTTHPTNLRKKLTILYGFLIFMLALEATAATTKSPPPHMSTLERLATLEKGHDDILENAKENREFIVERITSEIKNVHLAINTNDKGFQRQIEALDKLIYFVLGALAMIIAGGFAIWQKVAALENRGNHGVESRRARYTDANEHATS